MSSELRQSVKEYRKIWEEAGVDFLSPRFWTLTRRAAPAPVPAPSPPALPPSPALRAPSARFFYGQATAAGKCRVLFVGDAEGFSDEAGQLLGKIIDAMELGREKGTYLADPNAEWSSFLREQVGIAQPAVVVALGPVVAASLLGGDGIASLRGKWHSLPWSKEVALRVTFHPAHLLTAPASKKEVWEDMKLVLQKLGGAAK